MQSKKILLLVIVFGVIAGAFLIWLFWPEGANPSPTVDETADWQTYKYQNYGFEFKFPGECYEIGGHDLNLEIECSNEVLPGRFVVGDFSRPESDICEKPNSNILKIINDIEYCIDESRSTETSDIGTNYILEYVTRHSNSWYSIGLRHWTNDVSSLESLRNSEEAKKEAQLLEKMLSTFKFID